MSVSMSNFMFMGMHMCVCVCVKHWYTFIVNKVILGLNTKTRVSGLYRCLSVRVSVSIYVCNIDSRLYYLVDSDQILHAQYKS